MLDYARSNRTDIHLENIDLKEMIRNKIQELQYLDNFKDVKTSVRITNVEIPFKSDRLRTEVIFANIISNAYKYYNPEVNSYLRIRIKVKLFAITIEFSDNGIGIKPEYLDKIFNMFYRATDRSQGSGLGM
jgi:signal transduction histidine kinase